MTKTEKDRFIAQVLDEIRKVAKKSRKGNEFNPKEFERLLVVRTKELRGERKKANHGVIFDGD